VACVINATVQTSARANCKPGLRLASFSVFIAHTTPVPPAPLPKGGGAEEEEGLVVTFVFENSPGLRREREEGGRGGGVTAAACGPYPPYTPTQPTAAVRRNPNNTTPCYVPLPKPVG
jgi:hypothetical protein